MSDRREHLILLDRSFPGIRSNIERYESLGFSWDSSKPFIKTMHGEAVSHVGLMELKLCTQGKERTIGALHAICTAERFRRQGFARELIHQAVNEALMRYESVILFTEIPKFYEALSFQQVKEHRFRLPLNAPAGSSSLRPMTFPEDNALFLRLFKERAPLSENVWIEDRGGLTAFNTLFATYPSYWSLSYSPSLNAVLSFMMEGSSLHLLDVAAKKLPSLEAIIDHMPKPVTTVYFYFSPDRFTAEAKPEPYLYDNGYLMNCGEILSDLPFMIQPLSRC